MDHLLSKEYGVQSILIPHDRHTLVAVSYSRHNLEVNVIKNTTLVETLHATSLHHIGGVFLIQCKVLLGVLTFTAATSNSADL